jgi:hypothetical protein
VTFVNILFTHVKRPQLRVVSFKPRLEILDLQLFSMGTKATPSQLRSLTMSKAAQELGGNVVSAKDLLTVSQKMKKITGSFWVK